MNKFSPNKGCFPDLDSKTHCRITSWNTGKKFYITD